VVEFKNRSSYADWRREALDELCLREADEAGVPERVLQVVWQHQRLRDDLRLCDGRSVRVLHPGFWNHGAGPDFRKAVVAIEGEEVLRGDVEVDVEPAGWHAHGHDRNPSFANTILRVVWSAPETAREPWLCLRDQLDAPWPKLREWALREPPGELPDRLRGVCCEPLKRLTAGQLDGLLNEAGIVRLEGKAAHFEALARARGWEAALMIGLVSGLGYKRNAWPMRRVAEAMLLLDRSKARAAEREEMTLALMLGISGFMPHEWSAEDRRRSDYLSRLWSLWWRLREDADEFKMPIVVWQLGGVRPVNRPERRLALAARWLADDGLIRRIEDWSRGDSKPAVAARELMALLGPTNESFWEDRCTFVAGPMPGRVPLLGRSRLNELAVNTVLPWLHARARAGRNRALVRRVEQLFLTWPKAEDNAVLRLARRRLLGETSAGCLRGAGQQQGLLQIVRDFCARTDALCTDCPFPAYAGSLAESGARE
jgi:hypothetical protein